MESPSSRSTLPHRDLSGGFLPRTILVGKDLRRCLAKTKSGTTIQTRSSTALIGSRMPLSAQAAQDKEAVCRPNKKATEPKYSVAGQF